MGAGYSLYGLYIGTCGGIGYGFNGSRSLNRVSSWEYLPRAARTIAHFSVSTNLAWRFPGFSHTVWFSEHLRVVTWLRQPSAIIMSRWLLECTSPDLHCDSTYCLTVFLPVKVVLKFVVATKRCHGPHTKGVWEKHLSRGVDPDLKAKRSFNIVELLKQQVYPGLLRP